MTYNERGENVIRIPDECVSKAHDLEEFIKEIYDDIDVRLTGPPEYFAERAIVSPKNALIDSVNKLIRSHVHIQPQLSADECGDDDDAFKYAPELLNKYTPSGCAPHKLYLEERQPIILIRTIDRAIGACNGTRLIINKMYTRCLDCVIIAGEHVGQRVFIPRTLMTSKKNMYAFQLRRWQFPVRPVYDMTISKSQGQSFKKMGVYLPQPVFAHG